MCFGVTHGIRCPAFFTAQKTDAVGAGIHKTSVPAEHTRRVVFFRYISHLVGAPFNGFICQKVLTGPSVSLTPVREHQNQGESGVRCFQAQHRTGGQRVETQSAASEKTGDSIFGHIADGLLQAKEKRRVIRQNPMASEAADVFSIRRGKLYSFLHTAIPI